MQIRLHTHRLGKNLAALYLVIAASFTQSVLAHNLTARMESHEKFGVNLELVKNNLGLNEPVLLRLSYTNKTAKTANLLTRGTAFDEGFYSPYLRVVHNNREVTYLGVILSRKEPTDQEYLEFAPGETRSETIDISDQYDFSKAGIYEFSARYMHSNTVELNLQQGRVASTRSAKIQDATCTGTYAEFAAKSQGRAVAWLRNADAVMKSVSAQQRPNMARYQTWFGDYDAQRWNTVARNISDITKRSRETIRMDCDCLSETGPVSAAAYVLANRNHEIFLCQGAFDNGLDFGAELIIHEISHFGDTGAVVDFEYGERDTKTLALSRPADAINNADSYSFFVRNRERFQPVGPFFNEEPIKVPEAPQELEGTPPEAVEEEAKHTYIPVVLEYILGE